MLCFVFKLSGYFFRYSSWKITYFFSEKLCVGGELAIYTNTIRWPAILHFLLIIHTVWSYDIIMQSKEIGLLQNWTKFISSKNTLFNFWNASSLIALLISDIFLQCKKASNMSPLHSYTNFRCFKKCFLAAQRCIIWANIAVFKVSEALHYRLRKIDMHPKAFLQRFFKRFDVSVGFEDYSMS